MTGLRPAVWDFMGGVFGQKKLLSDFWKNIQRTGPIRIGIGSKGMLKFSRNKKWQIPPPQRPLLYKIVRFWAKNIVLEHIFNASSPVPKVIISKIEPAFQKALMGIFWDPEPPFAIYAPLRRTSPLFQLKITNNCHFIGYCLWNDIKFPCHNFFKFSGRNGLQTTFKHP